MKALDLAPFQKGSWRNISRWRQLTLIPGLPVTRDGERSGVLSTPGPDRRSVEGRPNRIRGTQSNPGKQNP